MSTDISEVRADDGVSTSEMSVSIQLRTWQYIPEDSELVQYCVLCVKFLQYLPKDQYM